ncbi:hypothetical protein PInf_011524 [Phytophthora infestans]|nr:hypothetical protein PInf_011524 [Phytophthora infestans]
MRLPCRHAIAYRKHVGVSGSVIPWGCIDERWTTPNRPLKQVKQFTYEKFSCTGSGSTRKKMRTQSERYREAVRAAHLIASEMADIQDEKEVDEMLSFVLSQWRNARQGRMKEVPDGGNVADDHTSGDEEKANEAAARLEFDISSSENEDDQQAYNQVIIRMNPKAKKVGAPRKMKKKTVSGEKEGRKWFEAAEYGRKIAGEETLIDLLNSLDQDKPELTKTQKRLSGVIVRHSEFDNNKPKMKISKNPVLVQDPFYLLPSKILDACVRVLPLSNTKATAISLDGSQPYQTQSVEDKATPQSVETVLIKDVGQFSRKQIETFKRVRNLKELVELGLDTAEKNILIDAARDCVLKHAEDDGVESVFVPLNFGNLHWCCVVVKVAAKRIFYYDPLNQASYMNASKEVAVTLKIAGLNDFDVIPMNNPIQFDGFSCGVFVCWMFIRQITCVPPQDMSDASLPRRRFELLCYLLTDQLLPAEAAATALPEEKAPVPGSVDNDMDEEEVAPTQVAEK